MLVHCKCIVVMGKLVAAAPAGGATTAILHAYSSILPLKRPVLIFSLYSVQPGSPDPIYRSMQGKIGAAARPTLYDC